MCSVCWKSFLFLDYFKQHQKIHISVKPHVCSECGNSFMRARDLERHERIHTGEKPFKCSQCGKCFTESRNLVKHERVHTEEKPYHCLSCGRSFRQSCSLLTHVKKALSTSGYSVQPSGFGSKQFVWNLDQLDDGICPTEVGIRSVRTKTDVQCNKHFNLNALNASV